MNATPGTIERMHRDVAVAEVFAPEHSPHPQREARVFVTNLRVQVWVRGPEGPVALVDEPLTGEPPERDRGTLAGQLSLETATGPVYVTRGRGCGCGSGLKELQAPASWYA